MTNLQIHKANHANNFISTGTVSVADGYILSMEFLISFVVGMKEKTIGMFALICCVVVLVEFEADRELNATLEKRGYSGSEIIPNEKPSSILKKIEIGTNYLKEYLSKNINRFWGHELNSEVDSNDEIAKEVVEHRTGQDENDKDLEKEQIKEKKEDEEDYDDESDETKNSENKHVTTVDSKNDIEATTEGDVEFFDINDTQQGNDDDDDLNGQLKRPGGGGGKRKKNKNKRKKGQQNDGGVQVQPATVLLLQQPNVVEEHHDHGGAGTEEVHVSSGQNEGKPNKLKRKKDRRQKRRKNKNQHQNELETTDDDLISSLLEGHGGLELLENFSMDDWLEDGGKRKKGFPSKYGRSNGGVCLRTR